MDFIDRMLLRVLAWPGTKSYYTIAEMRERLREITGERTLIGDHWTRLHRMVDLGWVQVRQRGCGRGAYFNVTELGKEQLCRREKAG